MRVVLPLAAIAVMALLLSACGGDEDTLESLAGTPASIHIVNDVEAMAKACKDQNHKTREAGVKAFTNLAKITSIHPKATFGPEEENELTTRQLLRRTVEKTGHCIGVTVNAEGKYSTG